MEGIPSASDPLPGGTAGPELPSGLAGSALRGMGSLLRYFQALLALAKVEAREASVQYLKVLICAVMGLLFLAFGYVSFLLFVAFLLGGLFGISWLWITLGLTLLHLVLVLICAALIKNALDRPVFPALSTELRRDARALGATSNPPSQNPIL